MIRVGDTAEVIEITDNSDYPNIYNNGNTGVIVLDFRTDGSISALVGSHSDFHGWHVRRGCFKRVAKLTVKSLKNG